MKSDQDSLIVQLQRMEVYGAVQASGSIYLQGSCVYPFADCLNCVCRYPHRTTALETMGTKSLTTPACTIVYFMTNQPYEALRYTQFLSITILTCLVAQSIGLLISTVAPSLQTAVYVAPVTGIPVLLFSGFFVNFDTIPKYMKWLSYVSYARYSWEGTVVAIYGNKRGPLECKDERCIFENSKDVLDAMDVEENALFLEGAKIYFDAVVLVLFFITLRLASYLVLRYKVKSYH